MSVLTCVGAGASGADLAEVMRLTAEAVTQCKFEATDPAADEVVLFKILQVRYTPGAPFIPTLTAMRARSSPSDCGCQTFLCLCPNY